MEIQIERHPTSEKLEKMGVFNWSIWTREASQFPWTYDRTETCYFLAGEVTVTPERGIPIKMGKGDLVTFPMGMSCTWKITQDVKKHYKFS